MASKITKSFINVHDKKGIMEKKCNLFYLWELYESLIDRLNLGRRKYVGIDDIEEMQEVTNNALRDSCGYFWDKISRLEKKTSKILVEMQLAVFEVIKSDNIGKIMEKDKKVNLDEIKEVLEDFTRKEILEKHDYNIPKHRLKMEFLAHQFNKYGRY